MPRLPCRASQRITQEDNSPHTRPQSYCIVQLNHLLNRGKLTSITNNINSFSAPRGILLLRAEGWMLAFQQSLNKHPLQDLFHAWVRSTCRAAVWKVSAAADVIVCNKSYNKVKVELACCCGGARGKRTLRVERQPSDKAYSYPKILNGGCQVGCRWSARHIKNTPSQESFSYFYWTQTD